MSATDDIVDASENTLLGTLLPTWRITNADAIDVGWSGAGPRWEMQHLVRPRVVNVVGVGRDYGVQPAGQRLLATQIPNAFSVTVDGQRLPHKIMWLEIYGGNVIRLQRVRRVWPTATKPAPAEKFKMAGGPTLCGFHDLFVGGGQFTVSGHLSSHLMGIDALGAVTVPRGSGSSKKSEPKKPVDKKTSDKGRAPKAPTTPARVLSKRVKYFATLKTPQTSKFEKQRAILETAKMVAKGAIEASRVAAKRATSIRGEIVVGAARPKAFAQKARIEAASRKAKEAGERLAALAKKYEKRLRDATAKRKATKMLGDLADACADDGALFLDAIRSPMGGLLVDAATATTEIIGEAEEGEGLADLVLEPVVDEQYWTANPHNLDQTIYKWVPVDGIPYDGSRGFPNDAFGSWNFWFGPNPPQDGYWWVKSDPSWYLSPVNSNPHWVSRFKNPAAFKSAVRAGGIPGDRYANEVLQRIGYLINDPDDPQPPNYGADLGWGPLIGNPIGPTASWTKGLRFATEDKLWFWSPLEAPQWAKNQAGEEARNEKLLAQQILAADEAAKEAARIAKEKADTEAEATADKERQRQQKLEDEQRARADAERQRQQAIEDEQRQREEAARQRDQQAEDERAARQQTLDDERRAKEEERDFQRQLQWAERFPEASPQPDESDFAFSNAYGPEAARAFDTEEPSEESVFEEGALEAFDLYQRRAEAEDRQFPTVWEEV